MPDQSVGAGESDGLDRVNRFDRRPASSDERIVNCSATII
jgi:hypothetical protein